MKLLKGIIQLPNPPLIFWIVSEIVSLLSNGVIQKVSTTTALMSLTVWAYLELTSGINLFRKILGGIVLLFTAFTLFNHIR